VITKKISGDDIKHFKTTIISAFVKYKVFYFYYYGSSNEMILVLLQLQPNNYCISDLPFYC